MNNTIIFTGSGGQGILSMGIMLAQSALEAGKFATFMPSYGPEQRGGSAKCTVIIGEEEILSPMAGECEALVAMSEVAYRKYIHELLPGGMLIYDNTMVTEPIKRTDISAIPIPAEDLALEIGSPKVANVIIDGVLVGLLGMVSPEDFRRCLEAKFANKSQQVRDLNAKALEKGLRLAKQHILK